MPAWGTSTLPLGSAACSHSWKTLFGPLRMAHVYFLGGNPVISPAYMHDPAGGKLLGLSGSVGGGKNGRGCGGGADAIANKCFSFRSMWRRDGQGEAYLYVPQGRQASGFCPQEGRSSGVNGGFPGCTTRGPYPCTECNNKAGYSFGRGSFKFRRGEWNKIHMSLTLNTAGQADGKIEMQHNGVTVLSYDKMVWRLSPGESSVPWLCRHVFSPCVCHFVV